MNVITLINKYYPDVIKVVDANRPVRVDVTQEDCAKGNRKAVSSCAMAKALEREYDGAIISTSVSYLIRGTKATRYATPESVARELVSFDRHSDFSPGRYSLNPPSPACRLEAKRVYANEKAGTRARTRTPLESGYKNHKTIGIRSI